MDSENTYWYGGGSSSVIGGAGRFSLPAFCQPGGGPGGGAYSFRPVDVPCAEALRN